MNNGEQSRVLCEVGFRQEKILWKKWKIFLYILSMFATCHLGVLFIMLIIAITFATKA